MNPIQWQSLQTFDDWSNTLNLLLTEAGGATVANDVARKVSVQQQFKAFIDHSPNPMANRLDEIAEQAVFDIFADTLEKAMASIGSRTAELAAHVKTVKAVTADAQLDAASIRLDRCRRVVSASTEAIRAMVELRAALQSSAADKKLGQNLDTIVAAIQNLRNQVEAIGPS